MTVLLLNYSHPLNETQIAQITALLGETPTIRNGATQVDRARPLAEVARELADNANLSPTEWQSQALLINPPALAPVGLALLAELHGRCGYFPPILNIRPDVASPITRYEVGEIVNLQAIREVARQRREGTKVP